MRDNRILLSLLLLLSSCARQGTEVSLAPRRFIATLKIPDNIKVEIAAEEPQIVDPVACAFDADGRMYVVEMRDYPVQVDPNGPPMARIRQLVDADGDGYYERSTIFADGLLYATSVLPWRNGVLATSPPDILYLKDTDGDGRADVREVLFTGFPVSNTQHNINSMIWGLDNWVYAANGGNNGSARRSKFPDRSVSLQRMDFRFRPNTGEIETSYESTGGFGIAADLYGRMFGTHNTNHIQHVVLRSEYLARNKHLLIPSTRHAISDHGTSARLFQISTPETRFNHPEQSGHFSGGCGLAFYAGGLLPAEYDQSFFVADVVVNVVHQDIPSQDGPSFKTRRAHEEMEFLAGKDNWFRPVWMAVGPEGALYLVDMHRAVIEHPEWIPEASRRGINLRAGEDKGRIYRIVPKEKFTRPRPALSSAGIEVLIGSLGSTNIWSRQTAQRLLVERRDKAAIPHLVLTVRDESTSPLARVHALWTLEGMKELPTPLIGAGLADSEPGVRENALRLAEPRLAESAPLREAVLRMAEEPDPRVRFQLALTLGGIRDKRVLPILLRILEHDLENSWARYAALLSLSEESGEAISEILSPARPFRSTPTDGKKEFVKLAASVVGARAEMGSIRNLLALTSSASLGEIWQAPILDGLADGLARAPSPIVSDARVREFVDRLIRSKATPVVRASLRVASRLGIRSSEAQDRALAQAARRVLDSALTVQDRLQEVELLGLGAYDRVGRTLLDLLDPREPQEMQTAAARVFSRFTDEAAGEAAISNWRRFSPPVKTITLNMLLRRPPFHLLIVEALEKKKLTFGELNLDLEQRRRLLRHSTEDIQKRAASLFGDHEFSNRKSIVEDFIRTVIPLRGDPARGDRHFQTLCAKCHLFRGEGFAVGPDLSMAFSKGKEDLLTSILDPNAAIEPEFTNYLITTVKGDLITGIIKSETPSSITLMRASGESDTVHRSQIREIRTDGLSLMPEEMEKGLSPSELADLLAFLQLHRH